MVFSAKADGCCFPLIFPRARVHLKEVQMKQWLKDFFFPPIDWEFVFVFGIIVCLNILTFWYYYI